MTGTAATSNSARSSSTKRVGNRGRNPRRDGERIAVLVPTWNIETWLVWLGGSDVDESEKDPPKLPRKGDCQPEVNELTAMCQSGNLRDRPHRRWSPRARNSTADTDEFAPEFGSLRFNESPAMNRTPTRSLSSDEFLRRIAATRMWRQDGQRAPHKLLLLLLAIGRVSQDKPRLASHNHEIRRPFREHWHTVLATVGSAGRPIAASSRKPHPIDDQVPSRRPAPPEYL